MLKTRQGLNADLADADRRRNRLDPDDNGPMKSIADIIGSEVTKTYRIYEKAL